MPTVTSYCCCLWHLQPIHCMWRLHDWCATSLVYFVCVSHMLACWDMIPFAPRVKQPSAIALVTPLTFSHINLPHTRLPISLCEATSVHADRGRHNIPPTGECIYSTRTPCMTDWVRSAAFCHGSKQPIWSDHVNVILSRPTLFPAVGALPLTMAASPQDLTFSSFPPLWGFNALWFCTNKQGLMHREQDARSSFPHSLHSGL